MGSLKRKRAFSYGLLVVILAAVSVWGGYHFVRLGRAVDVILVNNYKSILAAENMKEALERQDSSAMFFVAGHADKARRQFSDHSERCAQEFSVAERNITEKGEGQIVNDIKSQYADYRQSRETFLNPTRRTGAAEQSDLYFTRLEPAFLALKDRI